MSFSLTIYKLGVVIYRGGIFASLRCAREAKIPSLYITKKNIFFCFNLWNFSEIFVLCMYPSGVWQNRRWLHFLCQMLLFKRHRKWMMEGDSSGGACCSRDTQEVNDEGWHLRRGLLLAQRGGVIRLSNWLMGTTSYTALWVKALHLWLFSK